MAQLPTPFDSRVVSLLRRAESDPEAAAALLTLAVEYLRERKAMPDMLTDYLADAFESAASKPQEHRAKQLTDELNLTANNRRKVSATWLDAYDVIKSNEGFSINALSKELGKRFGIGTETARTRIIEAMKYIEKE